MEVNPVCVVSALFCASMALVNLFAGSPAAAIFCFALSGACGYLAVL